MKIIQVAFYGIFCFGFLLKFFHIHYNAILMLIGLGGMLITSIFLLSGKENRLRGLFHFGVFTWLALLFISIKFLPFADIALIVASAITLLILIGHFRKRQIRDFLPLSICIALALTFYFLRTDYKYFILNIKWNYEIDSDFMTLDKYSWFLYQNSEFEKALEVSDRALETAGETHERKRMTMIEEHRELIRTKDWEHYQHK